MKPRPQRLAPALFVMGLLLAGCVPARTPPPTPRIPEPTAAPAASATAQLLEPTPAQTRRPATRAPLPPPVRPSETPGELPAGWQQQIERAARYRAPARLAVARPERGRRAGGVRRAAGEQPLACGDSGRARCADRSRVLGVRIPAGRRRGGCVHRQPEHPALAAGCEAHRRPYGGRRRAPAASTRRWGSGSPPRTRRCVSADFPAARITYTLPAQADNSSARRAAGQAVHRGDRRGPVGPEFHDDPRARGRGRAGLRNQRPVVCAPLSSKESR